MNKNDIEKTQSFIEKAVLIHGDRYDYNKTKYVSVHEKVEIICKKHGSFFQTPGNHISRKAGCKLCATEISVKKHLKPVEIFVEMANKKFNNKFDYTQIQYKNTKTKVKIICKKHGEFFQTPEKHLSSLYGCPFCAREVVAKQQTKPIDDLLIELTTKHKGKFIYMFPVDTQTITLKNYMSVYCVLHGWFKQKISNHINGNGCISCAKERSKLTTKQFIEKAILVHGDRYDYSNVKYVSTDKKIEIICKKHGSFFQTPNLHLQGSGCRKCSMTGVSLKATKWLNEIAEQQNVKIFHEFRIPNTKMFVDGYCAETNTVYEFYGDAWHGNPNIFSNEQCCHPKDKNITAQQLYQQTKTRENLLRQLGYNLITIWESEYDTNTKF